MIRRRGGGGKNGFLLPEYRTDIELGEGNTNLNNKIKEQSMNLGERYRIGSYSFKRWGEGGRPKYMIFL